MLNAEMISCGILYMYWGFQSVVPKSGQKMALRAFYFINGHRTCGHIATESISRPSFGWYMKKLIGSTYRAFQTVVFNSGQKMALRVFYFVRTLTKAYK